MAEVVVWEYQAARVSDVIWCFPYRRVPLVGKTGACVRAYVEDDAVEEDSRLRRTTDNRQWSAG